MHVTHCADSLGTRLFPTAAKDRQRIIEDPNGLLDCHSGGVEGSRPTSLGLRGRIIPAPPAVPASVAQEPGLFVQRFGYRTATGAGEIILPVQSHRRPRADLLCHSHPRHDVVQLSVAAQHGLVIAGFVRFFQPNQHIGLQPGQLKSIRQRPPHLLVPLRSSEETVTRARTSVLGQLRGGVIWLHYARAPSSHRNQNLPIP